MPKRGSQSVHDNDYRWLVEVYGERCIVCGEGPEKGLSLQVDHISYEKTDYDLPSNKSLVCAGCNNRLRDVDALDPGRPEQHRGIIEGCRQKRIAEITSAREKSTPREAAASSAVRAIARVRVEPFQPRSL